MNILLITQFPPPNGGIASWSQAFFSGFEQLEEGCFRRGDVKIAAVNNAIIGKRTSQINGRKTLADEIRRALRMLRGIRKALRNGPIDGVHFNITCAKMGMLRDLLVLALIPRRIPVVLHCHCSVPDQVDGSRLSRWLFRSLLDRCALVLVLNQVSKAYLDALTASGKKVRCEIVPNPIEVSWIRPAPIYSAGRLRRVIYTGRFEPAKGAAELLEMAKRFPEVEFRLVGAVDDSISPAAFPANITALGNVSRERVLEELDQADVFLFPSHAEGFSMSMLEAMARGLPIVASDVGANREMLGADGGFIFEKGDIAGMAEALKALDDPAQRAKCGRANVRKAQEEYTTDAVAARIIALYRSMIK